MQRSNYSNAEATSYKANRSHCRDAEIQRQRYAPNLPVVCYCRQHDCSVHQREAAIEYGRLAARI